MNMNKPVPPFLSYSGSGDSGTSQHMENSCPKAIQINLGRYREHSEIFDVNVSTLEISGNPIEVTIECDYKTITVSGGVCHKIYIIGICNKVNLTGDLHSVFFEGFSNEVNFLSTTFNTHGKCAVWGEGDDINMNCKLGFTNGSFMVCCGPRPEKLQFPERLREGRRHRLIWRPAAHFSSESFMSQTPPKPRKEKADENQVDIEEVEWIDEDVDDCDMGNEEQGNGKMSIWLPD